MVPLILFVMIRLRQLLKPVFDDRKFAISEATASIIAAGINAGAGVTAGLTTGLGSRANRHEARRQFNESMAQHQIDQQMAYDYADMDWQRNRDAALEDWQRETQYNSASAVAARYRAAGLNPALMMQGQNVAQGSMNPSSTVSPSASSQSASPTAQMPDPSALGNAIQSFGDIGSRYFDTRFKAEQVEQLQIDNQFRAMQHITDIQQKIAHIDYELSQKGKNEAEIDNLRTTKKILENDLKFSVETFEDRKQGIKRDNNVKRWQAKLINSQYDAQEIQNSIEREFGRSKALMSLRLNRAQIAGIAQDIAESRQRVVESGERITDMRERLKYYRHEVDSNVKIAFTNAGLDTSTKAGKIALRRIAAAYYNDLRSWWLPNPIFGNGVLSDQDAKDEMREIFLDKDLKP